MLICGVGAAPLTAVNALQVYIGRDRAKTERLVRGLKDKGFKVLILTVDAPVPGKRELDRRTKGDFVGPAYSKGNMGGGQGVAVVRF